MAVRAAGDATLQKLSSTIQHLGYSIVLVGWLLGFVCVGSLLLKMQTNDI